MSHNTISRSVGSARTDVPVTSPTGLEGARERRIDLRQAMDQLERRVARPTAAAPWLAEVESALLELGDALDAHISEVEGEDGLLASIVADAPRLANQAAEIRREHAELRAGLDRCAEKGGLEPGQIRRRVTALLGRLALHRQLGSELVFDAYNVDIGDGD